MTSLLANFFKRNVTLNMGATDERRPQTAYIPEYSFGNDNAYQREEIFNVYGLSAKDIYGDKETLSKGVWNMPYDKPAYFKPTVDWLAACPYCGKQYYVLSDNEKCEHWNGATWTKNPQKEDESKIDGPKITKSRRGKVISGYGRIDSGFDWE